MRFRNLALPALAALACLHPVSPARAVERPSVVLIMCDDLGWGDVGFNGGTHIRTPNLDEMAANGLKLNRFYAQCAVCSPTRASVVTGRHHDRVGIPNANAGHLHKHEFTIYEALGGLGYRTGHFGKWHMGTLTRETIEANRGGPRGKKNYSPPWHHDVGTSFATESKTPTYDPMWRPAKGNGARKPSDVFDTFNGKGWNEIPEGAARELYNTFYWTGEETRVDPESETLMGDDSKVIMDQALPFIQAAAESEEPFFSIVWFHAPHLPCVASEEDAASYDDGQTSAFERNYYGCVTAVDREVGRLRDHLRQLGVADNTLVAFCSDNGPEGSNGAPGLQGRFRGRKRDLYEGGVRVPGLIEWPARIKPGETDSIACTVDYFPTLMEIMDFKMPDDRPIDGVSLMPLFTDSSVVRDQPLGFGYGSKAAWHDGPFKIIRQGAKAKWELYDLDADPSESKDLASSQPERLGTMTKAWTNWSDSVDRSKAGADYPE